MDGEFHEMGWTYENAAACIRHQLYFTGLIYPDGSVQIEDCEIVSTEALVGKQWLSVPHEVMDVRHDRAAWDDWCEIITDVFEREFKGLSVLV